MVPNVYTSLRLPLRLPLNTLATTYVYVDSHVLGGRVKESGICIWAMHSTPRLALAARSRSNVLFILSYGKFCCLAILLECILRDCTTRCTHSKNNNNNNIVAQHFTLRYICIYIWKWAWPVASICAICLASLWHVWVRVASGEWWVRVPVSSCHSKQTGVHSFVPLCRVQKCAGSRTYLAIVSTAAPLWPTASLDVCVCAAFPVNLHMCLWRDLAFLILDVAVCLQSKWEDVAHK